MNRTVAGPDGPIPFVMIGKGEPVPWGDDRTCPECGAPNLPLESSTSQTGKFTLRYINHCGMQWLRGPMDVKP